MLPTTTPPQSPNASPSRSRPRAGASSTSPSGSEPLNPIGPERMRRLREAIENGSYPSEADVLGGLARLLGDPSE